MFITAMKIPAACVLVSVILFVELLRLCLNFCIIFYFNFLHVVYAQCDRRCDVNFCSSSRRRIIGVIRAYCEHS